MVCESYFAIYNTDERLAMSISYYLVILTVVMPDTRTLFDSGESGGRHSEVYNLVKMDSLALFDLGGSDKEFLAKSNSRRMIIYFGDVLHYYQYRGGTLLKVTSLNVLKTYKHFLIYLYLGGL